ncbi:MAG TPA: hypothetical protein VJ654_11500 [Noviherbaspirillum sp.]|uniref:hypothetical protein n=1 Tax=Noviherbaspirillum sp. TaxID=1926288 RepID=UPI002B484755|nr:hypothetical protein [Noviherbaspirillum sp.]HJV74839.1 hypothetical protein [Noviherbaspirillum sp.]HJV80310.1 hypothetical protein [Noviherbaspirillum sp.]
MRTTPKKFCFVLAATVLSAAASFASSQNPQPQKVYTEKERLAEEARIRKDIEEKLDWRNRTKETLDDYDDAHRMLYGTLNESILLHQATGERFGIFESINEKTHTKRLEIRLHEKNKLTDRFLSGAVYCDTPAISADKVTTKFVLYREVCYRNNVPSHTLYLFDYASRNLYWVYTNEVTYSRKPTVEYQNGAYTIRWNVRVTGSTSDSRVVRHFKISKDTNGEWSVKDLPPINDETDGATPVEKLPVKSAYDLPAFVTAWGKR